MKRIILNTLLLIVSLSASSQLIRTEELEEYARERYGNSWVKAAANLGEKLKLDKNNSLSYAQIIECGDKTKEQLYILLNYWVSSSFNDANSVIQLNDKESGTIICQGFVPEIASNIGGINAYYINIKPILKIDIKDTKIRVTCSVHYYDIERCNGILLYNQYYDNVSQMKWAIDKCYPFTKKDSHKQSSSKALVMSHAYCNVMMDMIEECVVNGLVGNETEDW